ncbi:MAG: DUF6263 family protein [Bacteroidota bacterium]|nr:DUF6263 family protein [Bacteroidota bacterium]
MQNVFLILLSALSLTASAQKATGKINFTKGQKVEVVTNLNITAQSMMGPSSGTIVIADTYNVNEAAANSYTLVKTPKQVKMDFSVGSQQIKMNSDNPKDLSGPLGQPVKEIMSQKPEFTINAAGKITAVKATEKKNQAGTENNIMAMMLPGLDMASGLPKVGSPSLFQVLPDREVGVGDTWKDSMNADGNNFTSVYKVKEITDKEIIVDFETEGTTVTAQETMGMKVEVNADSKATGTISIDKATGIVKQKTTINNTETTINLAGREMTTTNKITSVMNVTAH